jgi:hypothetical protein
MDAQQLMEQAPTTVDFYLARAVLAIKNNNIPREAVGEVIAAYLAACTADYDTAIRNARS